MDVFSQYKFVNPAIFGSSFFTFRNRFFDMTGYGLHTPVFRTSQSNEFLRRLHSVAFRVTKAEALDLPPITEETRSVELEGEVFPMMLNLPTGSLKEFTNYVKRLLTKRSC